MESTVANILITFIIGSVTYFILKNIFKCKRAFKFWETRGVKTPKPILFFGNIIDMFFGDKVKTDREWRKTLGPNYGLYEGAKPRLVIGDPEIIRTILIKDFDVFPNTDLESNSNEIFGNTILCLKDDRWRRVRALMSPTFTTGKIRRMFPVLDGCCNDLINFTLENMIEGCVQNSKECLIHGKDISCLFTIDTICSCCYGIQMKKTNSKNLKEASGRDDVIRAGLMCFDFSTIGFVGKAILPEFLCNMFGIDPIPEKNMEPIQNIIKSMISKRRQMPVESRPKDYLQSLIDAKLVESDQNDHIKHGNLDDHEIMNPDKIDFAAQLTEQVIEESKSNKTKEIKLSDQEMYSQAVILLLAGLETTSNLISNCLYVLAHHADTIQKKLYSEIERLALSKNPEYTFDYDSLMSCEYLDSFIHETNRYLPIAVDLSRVANREYHIEKLGFSIPKGTIVDMAIRQIAFDHQYWDKPQKFDPERFMPNNRHLIVPGAYAPFGLGPRQCLGMRFALTETKLLLAKLLMKYRFEPAPGTTFPGKMTFHMAFLKLDNPLVKLSRRN